MIDTVTLTSTVDGFDFTAARAQPRGERKDGVVVVAGIFGLDQYVQAGGDHRPRSDPGDAVLARQRTLALLQAREAA